MTSHSSGGPPSDPLAAFEALALPELEEVAGELERRIGVALRRIGERAADEPDLGFSSVNTEGVSPRRRVATLAVESERTAFALGAVLAGAAAGDRAVAGHPALLAAMSYAAPSIAVLLARLDQDRRLLTSLARQLESRLDIAAAQLEGATPRRALIEVLLVEPGRCAQLLERHAGLRDL